MHFGTTARVIRVNQYNAMFINGVLGQFSSVNCVALVIRKEISSNTVLNPLSYSSRKLENSYSAVC